MPCYQINLVSLELKLTSKDRLVQALKEIGYRVEVRNDVVFAGDIKFDLARGNVTMEGSNRGAVSRLNRVNRKYSEIALREIAKKKRWAFKMQEENKIRMVRY